MDTVIDNMLTSPARLDTIPFPDHFTPLTLNPDLI